MHKLGYQKNEKASGTLASQENQMSQINFRFGFITMAQRQSIGFTKSGLFSGFLRPSVAGFVLSTLNRYVQFFT